MPVSEEERKEFLDGLGASDHREYQVKEEEEASSEEEVEASSEEEVEAPTKEEEVEAPTEEEGEVSSEVEVSSGEEEEEDLVEYVSSLLEEEEEAARTVEPSGEIERLRQELDLVKTALLKQAGQYETIAPSAQPAVPSQEESIDFSSETLIDAFANAGYDREEVKRFLPAFGKLAEFTADQRYGAKIKSLEEQNNELRQITEQANTKESQMQNLRTGLKAAREQGEVEAKLVTEFILAGKEGRKSVLSRHFEKFPFKLNSAEGVLDAVISTAGTSRIIGKNRPGLRGTREEVTGAISRATNTLPNEEEQNEKTPEELISDMIVGAKPKLARLPEGFRG